MPVAQSPDHYINSSKGCPSITESFPLVVFFSTVRHRRGIASGATPLLQFILNTFYGRTMNQHLPDFLFRWGRVNNNWESAPLKADIAPNFGAAPRQNRDQLRGPYHCLHIGLALAFKTRPLSTKSGNIMISGNVRILGIDINGSW
jgi:hypothetical protein